MRVIELEGIDNVRSLEGIPVTGNRVVAPGLLYRGSALAGTTERDRDVLFGELGIDYVIDLRCGWERDEKPDVEVPGVQNVHIPFYDEEKVGIAYTEPGVEGKVVGRDVACEPTSFYRSLANPLTVGQMKRAVNLALTRASGGHAVYVHCSGGKDRAGIASLLMLTVLGASREAILDDYLFTNVARDRTYDKLFERFLRLSDGDEGLARELVESHRALPQNLSVFYAAIEERYATMERFVHNQLGISDPQRRLFQERCTCEVS